ncbi:hypothetical protein POTOM_056080 [Populus tomentosa]|uniref:Uncharacterized protein n=1 Tax=Populus tomentosa TaxID=118781 RepID=A0A8X7XZ94_POPTO|nr:hypothetical protein POTOM_056080 [Populus tomentosa]
MASVSRLVLQDCNLLPCQAIYKPSSCFPSRRLNTHLDPRTGITVPGNGRIWTAQNKPRSPTVALTALSPSSIIHSSRNPQVLCRAATNATGDVPDSSTHGGMSQYERIIETLTTLFPVWVVLGTILGIYKPAAVTWLETDLFTLGLGFLMLSMGLTLTFEDFRRCLRNPWTVGVGFLAQYLIKPLLGFVIATVLLQHFLSF